MHLHSSSYWYLPEIAIKDNVGNTILIHPPLLISRGPGLVGNTGNASEVLSADECCSGPKFAPSKDHHSTLIPSVQGIDHGARVPSSTHGNMYYLDLLGLFWELGVLEDEKRVLRGPLGMYTKIWGVLGWLSG